MDWDAYYRLYYEDDDDDDDPENNYTYTTPPNMAEGGEYDPTTETTPLIPGDDDDDDTTGWDNQDLANKYPSGEQIPMTTRTRFPPELGPRAAETSFITGEPTAPMAWREVKWKFERADENRLKARYKVAPRAGGGGGGAIIEIAMRGKDKWYRLYTKSPGDADKSFNASLLKEIKTAFGKSINEQLTDTNAALQAKQNELAAKQKQLEQAEQRAAESQKLRRDMDALTNGIRDAEARMRALEDAHGSIDTEAIQREGWKLRGNLNGNNCHSFRRMQNKPTKYAQKSTNSCATREGWKNARMH